MRFVLAPYGCGNTAEEVNGAGILMVRLYEESGYNVAKAFSVIRERSGVRPWQIRRASNTRSELSITKEIVQGRNFCRIIYYLLAV